MLSEVIIYLMDPFLVARIQNFFGVELCGKANLSSRTKDDDSNDKNLTINHRVSKKNGCSTDKSETSCCTSTSHSLNYQENYSLVHDIKIPSDSLPIKNYFWYYLFLFSSELGDELFYTLFIAIWFWNIDALVGRKVILVWSIVMTTGQIMKDIIQWPRPACPPVVRLQNKWSQEYGMPSTHAAVSVSIPCSVILFTMNKYNYSIVLGMSIVIIWSTLICVSRLYLGMHSVLDVIAGLLLAMILMIPLVPFINYADPYLIMNHWALVILIVISITVVIYYPISDKWTPTRSDTTMVVSVVTGIYVGAWLNYQSGLILPNINPPPYDIVWPSYAKLGHIVFRTLLGICFAIPLKLILKILTYSIMCTIMQMNPKELTRSENFIENRNKIIVDLIYRFMYCFTFGIAIVYILPLVFGAVGLGRSDFYNEI